MHSRTEPPIEPNSRRINAEDDRGSFTKGSTHERTLCGCTQHCPHSRVCAVRRRTPNLREDLSSNQKRRDILSTEEHLHMGYSSLSPQKSTERIQTKVLVIKKTANSVVESNAEAKSLHSRTGRIFFILSWWMILCPLSFFVFFVIEMGYSYS